MFPSAASAGLHLVAHKPRLCLKLVVHRGGTGPPHFRWASHAPGSKTSQSRAPCSRSLTIRLSRGKDTAKLGVVNGHVDSRVACHAGRPELLPGACQTQRAVKAPHPPGLVSALACSSSLERLSTHVGAHVPPNAYFPAAQRTLVDGVLRLCRPCLARRRTAQSSRVPCRPVPAGRRSRSVAGGNCEGDDGRERRS